MKPTRFLNKPFLQQVNEFWIINIINYEQGKLSFVLYDHFIMSPLAGLSERWLSFVGIERCPEQTSQCVSLVVSYLQSSAGEREEETRGHRERERADGEGETGADDATLPVWGEDQKSRER